MEEGDTMLAGPASGIQEAQVPAYVRAKGGVRLRFGVAGGVTQRLELHESGGYRARLPHTFASHAEAVLINTGGGMASGDQLKVDISLDEGSHAVVATQAAEKIYRSQGPDTRIETHLALANGARLDWLPQETILFSGARLRRSLEVEMATDATLLACETVYFGRLAMGEILEAGAFRDSWRIRRGGKLVFAENVRLEGLINLTLAEKAVADGARAIATVLLLQPEANRRLEEVRHVLAGFPTTCGVSALDNMLVVRFLSPDPAALRRCLVILIAHLTKRALPRVWTT
jgi:urease accessory protein